MKSYKNIFVWLSLGFVLGFVSCSSNHETIDRIDISPVGIDNPSQALIELINKNGDYINAAHSPYLLDVSDVFYNKADYMLLDLRSQEDYEKGHIDGAIRVERENLLKYMAKNHAENFSKVILLDNTGLESAYAGSIIRAAGYTNCYPMKYGMAVWNSTFAKAWTNNLKSDFSSKLETKNYPKAKKSKLPTIKTNATTASGILEEQASKALSANFIVSAKDVMANKEDYYIINYWPTKRYEAGHLPSAVNYAPKSSLKLSSDLTTIPTNKKVALYCYTGSNASAVIGYLRLLGYDAYAINYGANGFMNSFLKQNKWHAFDISEKGNNFPTTKGPKASLKKEAKGGSASAPPPAPVVKRKKKSAGGGGCD